MRPQFLILSILGIALCAGSCKKSATITVKPTIIGKWQVVKLVVSYVRNDAQVNSSTRTNYTSSDYYQYFEDGTGLASANTPSENGVTRFTYTLKGQSLVQSNGGAEIPLNEIITNLTDSTLSIHYEVQAPDPITTVTETEKLDFDFKRIL